MACDRIVCAYCGKVREQVMFVIGAAREADWCIVAGTGKMTCPECYDIAMAEGQRAIDRATGRVR